MKDDYCLSNRERVLVERKERETFDWIGMSFLMRTKSAFEEEKRKKIFLRRTYCILSQKELYVFVCIQHRTHVVESLLYIL
jgi:hypothetical protein